MRRLPPAILLLSCFGAGLATGLARFGEYGPVGIALALGSVWWWRGWPGFALAALLLGRCLAWIGVVQATGWCEALLDPGAAAVNIVIEEPVHTDALLAHARLEECAGGIVIRWPAGTDLWAGTRVTVRGRWVERPEAGRSTGLLLARSFERHGFAPDNPDRLRNWLSRTMRALYGDRTATVEALVLNRRAGMAAELRDRYARAGLVHILSISGFHVGVIVAWCVLLGRLAGLTLVRAGLAGAMLATGYVAFLGWPAPAARAALLAGIVAVLHWRQRRPEPVPLLAVTCVGVILVDPWAVRDPGAWLSAGALAGALIATRWSDRALGVGWGWRMLSASVGATLATAPITAVLFGTVSLVGILLNFVAVPIAAVAVPGLIASLLAAALAPPLAPPLAAASGALLGLLDQVAWWGGQWDWSAVIQPAEPASALPWLGVLGLAAWSIAGGTTRWEAGRRLALGGAVAAWVLAGLSVAERNPDRDSGLTLHFLDVGQGDAALIRTPAGHWVLIDAGPRDDRSDAGKRVVAPFLARQRVARLTAAIVSHAHADHLGGLAAVEDRIPVTRVFEPAPLAAEPLYLALLDRLELEGTPWEAARDGVRFTLDGVRFTFLHPDTAWQGWQEDLNEDSGILLVEYAGFRAIFPGDAGLPAERRLTGRVGRVDVLKVAHHGSRWASGAPWLQELAPSVAIISTGRGNRYGHPHTEALDRLRAAGAEIWRTDEVGSIVVRTDGQSVTVSARGRRTTHQVSPSRGTSRAPEQPRHDDRTLHPGSGGEIP